MGSPANATLFLTTDLCTVPTRLANADGTTAKEVVAAQTKGQFVTSLIVTSTDTVARTLVLYMTSGGVDYPMGAISIPAGAGTDVTNAAVDLLGIASLSGLPVDANLKRFIYLDPNASLKVAVLVAVASGKFINVVSMGQKL